MTGEYARGAQLRAELMENAMNESLNNQGEQGPGYIKSIARDEGVHRAVAGVFVSVVIAAAKRALFPGA